MPRAAWSAKRERQYEHIKEGLEDHGRSADLAEEIAARTVNKERARSGEAATASKTSTDDISSLRRGGLRSHRGSGGRTRDQLYEFAWSAPMRDLAAKVGMSDVGLKKLLSNHGVPAPPSRLLE